MDIDTNRLTSAPDRRTDPTRTIRHLVLGGLVLATSLGGRALAAGDTVSDGAGAAEPVTIEVGTQTTVPAGETDTPDAPDASGPDAVSDEIGGLAARLHDADGGRVPGDVFLLMGHDESTATARLFDDTPYTHDGGWHEETRASSELAAEVAGRIVGADITAVELTGAPGGGPSGGITYAIAYLNVVSGGSFTGDLRVASTGRLGPDGHVNGIEHVDVKTVAAHLAEVDVFFTPSTPTAATRATYAARFVGESTRGASTGSGIDDPRRIDEFRRWGAKRPDGVDIVDTRHLVDVAAYLCGAGSAFACEVTDRLEQMAEERRDELAADRSETDRLLAQHP